MLAARVASLRWFVDRNHYHTSVFSTLGTVTSLLVRLIFSNDSYSNYSPSQWLVAINEY